VPIQAIPLALIASLYPFGLVALLLLFEAPRPKARSAAFIAGAAACTLTIGFLVVFVLRGAGVGKPSEQTPRYGLRVAIGVLFLVAAWVLARRAPKASGGASRISAAIAGSGLIAAFTAGLALYTPAPSYLAALQVVGSSKLSTTSAAVWVVIVVALVLITIEVPFLLYLFAPGRVMPRFTAATAWLNSNSKAIFTVVLVVLGIWQVVDGLVGLL
jgi:Sap, sulfolipid-1-addressing protein